MRATVLGMFLFVLASTWSGVRAQEDLDHELPRLEPTEPRDALATIRTLPDFRALLRAAEPVVTDPIVAAYDADGRLFVVEMGDYPFAENRPDGRVRELVDADGDGTYESSCIFLDGLAWPTGLTPYRDGWFVISAPDLLYARDTDGDGIADERRVVFTGFGIQNVQALANNLTWGPDGWIHGASGGNGGEIRRPDRPDIPPVTLRGNDFRFHPKTLAFETTTGGGQFGQTFDDWGHRFICSNSNHARQVVWSRHVIERNPAASMGDAIADIASDGPAASVFRISEPEPWRVVRTRRRAADPAMVQRISSTELSASGFFTSATGITVFRGTALGPEVEGNLIVGDVGGNLVHRKRLIADGPIYRAERIDDGVEFVASTDNWFRPANFANTPDGTLLVLDMYREAIEHPISIPDDIKAKLDLRSGRDRGRIYEVVREGFIRREKPNFSTASTADLVAALADRDGWRRETARRLLVERADPEAPALLRAMLEQELALKAIAAVLTTLDALGELTAVEIKAKLEHTDPRVRELVVRLAMSHVPGNPGLVEALANRASDPDEMVAIQAALAIGESRDAQSLKALAAFAERERDDPWLRRAVASGLRGQALPFAQALATRGIFNRPSSDGWADTLGDLIGFEGPSEAVDTFVSLLTQVPRSATRNRAILALSRGHQRSGGSAWSLLRGPIAETLKPLLRDAERIARNDSEETTQRIEAIRFLALGLPTPELTEALSTCLAPDQLPIVQTAAIRTAAQVFGSLLPGQVFPRWNGLSPVAKREAIEILMRDPRQLARLLDAIEQGVVAPGDLDRVRRAQLLAAEDEAIREKAEALLGRGVDRGAVVEKYRKELPPEGSAERGKALVAKHCATCHEPQGALPSIAPDLKTVAGRSRDDLVMHILDPNREVVPAMVVVNVATKDGRSFTGILARETDAALVLRRAEGAVDEVPRRDVEAIRSTGLSLMPEGLENELSPAALADVIEYLKHR